jgi:hypothetical protein
MHFHIRLTTALTNTRECWIDGVVCAKMHHVAAWGINVAILAGSTAFVHDDRRTDTFRVATTNDWAGLYGEWFGRMSDSRDILRQKYADIHVCLPASSSASNEFLESKAQ